jgi:hypothetical protein
MCAAAFFSHRPNFLVDLAGNICQELATLPVSVMPSTKSIVPIATVSVSASRYRGAPTFLPIINVPTLELVNAHNCQFRFIYVSFSQRTFISTHVSANAFFMSTLAYVNRHYINLLF